MQSCTLQCSMLYTKVLAIVLELFIKLNKLRIKYTIWPVPLTSAYSTCKRLQRQKITCSLTQNSYATVWLTVWNVDQRWGAFVKQEGSNAGAKDWAMVDESGESTDKDDLTCERRETESEIKGLGCVWRNETDNWCQWRGKSQIPLR